MDRAQVAVGEGRGDMCAVQAAVHGHRGRSEGCLPGCEVTGGHVTEQRARRLGIDVGSLAHLRPRALNELARFRLGSERALLLPAVWIGVPRFIGHTAISPNLADASG